MPYIRSKPVILQEDGSSQFLAKERYKKRDMEWATTPAAVIGPEAIVDS